MREKDIESWSKNLARKNGWWVRKFKSPSNRSVPDDIFCNSGRVFFVEFKATGEEPTELQWDEIYAIRAVGGTVYVCDSREQFANLLTQEELRLCSR